MVAGHARLDVGTAWYENCGDNASAVRFNIVANERFLLCTRIIM